MNPFLVLGIMAMLIFALMSRKLLTYIVILTCVVQTDWFVRYMNLPEISRRIPIIFSMLILIKISIDIATGYIKIYKRDKVIVLTINILSLLVAHFLLACTYGNQDYLLGIYSNRYLMTGVALVFAIRYYLYMSLSIEKVIKFFIVFALVQIPVSLIQFVLVERGGASSLDMVTGTFTGYADLVAFQTIAIGILIAEKQSGRNVLPKDSYLIAIICLIPLLLSNSKTAIIFPVSMILFQLTRPIKGRNVGIKIGQKILIIMMIAVTVFMFYNFFWLDRHDIARYSDKGYVTNYYMREAGETTERMGRVRAIVVAIGEIKKDIVTIVLGNAPGSVQLATLINRQGQYYQEHGNYAGLGRTQISLTLMEYGLVGLFIIFYVVRRLQYFSRKLDGEEQEKWRHLFESVILVMTIMAWYSLTITTYTFSGIIGVVIGLLEARRFRSIG